MLLENPPPFHNSIPYLFVNLSPTYILNEVMHVTVLVT